MRLTKEFVKGELAPFIKQNFGRQVKIDYLEDEIEGIQLVSKVGYIGLPYNIEVKPQYGAYWIDVDMAGKWVSITERFIEEGFDTYPPTAFVLATGRKEHVSHD